MSEKTYTQAELDAEVLGLKNKNSELLAAVSGLKNDLATTNSKFEGVDIEALKALAATAKNQEEKDLLDNGKFDQLMQVKIAEAMNPLQAQLEATKGELDAVIGERDKVKSDFSLTRAENFLRSEAGQVADLHSTAIDDIVMRGQKKFREFEGAFQAFDGDKPLFKDNKPLSGVQWIESMRDTHPHYFNKASGTGSTGSSSGGDDIASYFDKSSKNYSVTKQAEIAKSNPSQYETLSEQHS